jgi:RNA binding exosome subunit
MHYQHATEDRDRAIAEALSEFHAGNVIALRPKEGRTA